MIRNDLDRNLRAFKIMSPLMKGIEDSKEFFVVRIVVKFGTNKGSGMESDGMNISVGEDDGKDCCQSVVGSISFNNERLARNVMRENQG